MTEFKAFEKIARLNRDVVVTEKIDGTNAQVLIIPRKEVPKEELDHPTAPWMSVSPPGLDDFIMLAGSRTRWLGAEDNYGFRQWVSANREELARLGPGAHFGEWWGSGIQRRYGLTGSDKRLSLFNAGRWVPHIHNTDGHPITLQPGQEVAPKCCHVVPVLAIGTLAVVGTCIERLRESGSLAAPGFMDPEGVVVFHTAARTLFKVTLKNDDKAKGQK